MVTLPKPSGGFHWAQLPAGPALVCDALAPIAAHFFTTRSWRLGERTAGAADAADGWQEVAFAARVDVARLGRVHQVHGAEVVTYKKGVALSGGAVPTADIVLTDDASVAVDRGVVLPNVNEGFAGRAPDLGALEVGQPAPHYGPR